VLGIDGSGDDEAKEKDDDEGEAGSRCDRG